MNNLHHGNNDAPISPLTTPLQLYDAPFEQQTSTNRDSDSDSDSNNDNDSDHEDLTSVESLPEFMLEGFGYVGPVQFVREHTSTAFFQHFSGDPREVIVAVHQEISDFDVNENDAFDVAPKLNAYSYAFLMSRLKEDKAAELQRLVAEHELHHGDNMVHNDNDNDIDNDNNDRHLINLGHLFIIRPSNWIPFQFSNDDVTQDIIGNKEFEANEQNQGHSNVNVNSFSMIV